METRQWTNPRHPQTMQIAVFLLYANAVFGLLFQEPFRLFPSIIGVLVIVAYAAGGFGVANDRNWGYFVGVGVAALVVVATILRGIAILGIINLMFDVALLVLLLHPQSRNYQKIWFK
jgi:lysylphosphatidylglycerol synthetase-like protein (DUF2156 family)